MHKTPTPRSVAHHSSHGPAGGAGLLRYLDARPRRGLPSAPTTPHARKDVRQGKRRYLATVFGRFGKVPPSLPAPLGGVPRTPGGMSPGKALSSFGASPWSTLCRAPPWSGKHGDVRIRTLTPVSAGCRSPPWSGVPAGAATVVLARVRRNERVLGTRADAHSGRILRLLRGRGRLATAPCIAAGVTRLTLSVERLAGAGRVAVP